MPYKSDAQRRWAHTKAGKKALGGQKKVAEWDAASKGKDLPERVRKVKKGGVLASAAARAYEKVKPTKNRGKKNATG